MVDKLDRLMQFCTVSEQNYYKDWYEKNRGDLLARRRAKYRSDPEYAEKCKENARDYRKRAKKTERKEGPQTRERKPVLVDVGGQQRKGWSVGHLAKRINRSVPTSNHWAKHGLLPETPIRSDGGARLYTDAMIMAVGEAVGRRGQVSRRDESFRSEIAERWQELGVESD